MSCHPERREGSLKFETIDEFKQKISPYGRNGGSIRDFLNVCFIRVLCVFRGVSISPLLKRLINLLWGSLVTGCQLA